jgi:hypothetical protein
MGERAVDDYRTIAVDDRPVPFWVLVAGLEDALAGEGWGQPVRNFRMGSFDVAFKNVERRLSLDIVERPGRPDRCDLASEDGRWSVIIIGPTVGQVRAAASAATGESLETEADLVVSLRVAGWGVDVRPERPDGRGWATRADRRRYVDRMAGRAGGSVGGWYVQGDRLDVNASGPTPFAIVAALALS